MPLRVRAPLVAPIAQPSVTTWVNIDGTWRQATVWVNVDGVWKAATICVNILGTWK